MKLKLEENMWFAQGHRAGELWCLVWNSDFPVDLASSDDTALPLVPDTQGHWDGIWWSLGLPSVLFNSKVGALSSILDCLPGKSELFVCLQKDELIDSHFNIITVL